MSERSQNFVIKQLLSYLNGSSPLFHSRFRRHDVLLFPELMFFVNDFDDDQTETADDAEADEDEDAAHVLQAERRGRVVVVVAAVHFVVQQDPAVVQVLHFAAWKIKQAILIPKYPQELG